MGLFCALSVLNFFSLIILLNMRFICSFIHSFIDSSLHSFIHSFIRSPINPSIHSHCAGGVCAVLARSLCMLALCTR